MRILFICTGNMTRSPLAEAVLKKKLDDSGVTGVEVISAGTGATGRGTGCGSGADVFAFFIFLENTISRIPKTAARIPGTVDTMHRIAPMIRSAIPKIRYKIPMMNLLKVLKFLNVN